MEKKPLVIALFGYPLSGKDTIAQYLAKGAGPIFFEHWKVAFPIKMVACQLFGWDDDIFEDREKKEVIDPRWGVSPRQAAQFIGYDMVKAMCEKYPSFKETTGMNLFGKILANALRREINDPDSQFFEGIVISDIRFPSEYNNLIEMKNSGEIDLWLIKVVRKGTGPANNHVSESHYDDFYCGHEIHNSGTVEELLEKTDALLGLINAFR
jgi:hypothetical protein